MRIFIAIPDGKINILTLVGEKTDRTSISFGRYEVMKIKKPLGRLGEWYVLKGTPKTTFIGLPILQWEKLERKKVLSIQIERKRPSRVCPHCEGTGFLKKKPRSKKN